MLKKIFIIVGYVFVLGSIIFLYAFSQKRYNNHRISEMKIDIQNQDLKFLNDEMVNKLLIQKVGNPLNQMNSSINLHLIEETLSKHQMVEHADVFLNQKGQLQIQLEQRRPVVRIVSANESYYLDNNGLKMPLSDVYTERVILASGNFNKETEKELFELISLILKDSIYSKQIIGIERKLNGEYIFQPRIGNYVIAFGKMEDAEEKLEKLKVFYKKMWNDQVLNKYKTINIKYKNQVIGSY